MPRSLANCYENLVQNLDRIAKAYGRQGPSQRQARTVRSRAANPRVRKACGDMSGQTADGREIVQIRRPQRDAGRPVDILRDLRVFLPRRDIDRNAVDGQVKLAGQERLVVGTVVPGRRARNEIIIQSLDVFECLGGLR